MIVATAGHVDHGKTVLVKALSGVDSTGTTVRVIGEDEEPGPEIKNNGGPGFLADRQAILFFRNSTISYNTEEGVRLLHMSLAESNSGNTISGNGAADFSCDGTSLLYGDLTGISSIMCRNVEGDRGNQGGGGRP